MPDEHSLDKNSLFMERRIKEPGWGIGAEFLNEIGARAKTYPNEIVNGDNLILPPFAFMLKISIYCFGPQHISTMFRWGIYRDFLPYSFQIGQ